jgi:DNA-binding CsgD family transcriptional regulator
MPRLSAMQNEARARIARLAARALPPDALGEALMGAVCSAIPCDAYSLFAIDPDSLLFTRVLAGSGGPYAAGRLHWLRHTYLVRQPGSCNPPGMMHLGLQAVALHEDLRRCVGALPAFLGTDSPRAWWHRYHEIEGVPFRNVLGASCAADGRWVAGLTLVRADPTAAWFKPADVALLRSVAPIIGRAVRAALARERAGTAAGGDPDAAPGPAIGVIVLGRDGRVQSRNPAADGWIEALRETWMPRSPGIPQLPTAVWTALAALRAAGEEPAAPVLHVPSARGLVRIEASWDTGQEAAMVALAPVTPPAPPRLADDWPLTPQERRVLTCVAQGLTNRQVAAQLAMGERTVVSHLEHAYEKLGVHSRTQLLARLFQEAYLPGMLA